MKNNLIRMLALALCFCALLSFAACGEDAPAKDDDITPPANDTPTADEPEEPSADEPTKPDVPVEPSEPTEPDAPTEPSEPETPTEPDEPTEPEVPSEPDAPVEPDTPTEPEKWSSPEAQAMLEIYNEVLQGKRTLFNTYTKKEEYFADPENDPATILGRAQNRIIDFDQDGIPEVLVWFGSESSSMPYDVLYCIDGMIYCAPLQKRSISSTAYKGYIFVGSGGANTHYYSTYDLTKTGLSYTEIAKSDMKWDNITDQPLYYYELNGVEVTKEEFDAFLAWLEEDSAEPYIPNEPTEPTDNPAEPDEPAEPTQPTTSVAPEKWSSPEALEILSAYISVIRGQKTMIDTYTKEETNFSNPGGKTFSIWDETHVSIVDFNLDGLPEIIFTTGVFTFDGYDVLYSIGGKIYHSTLSFRGVDYVYKDHIIACGSGDNVYYDTYEPTETGLSINRIAKSLVFQDVQKGLIFSYTLYGNEVTEEQFTAWVDSLGEATPPLITYWM